MLLSNFFRIFLFSSNSCTVSLFDLLAIDMAHNVRDSAAADLPWPTRAPRASDLDDEDMTIPAFMTSHDSVSHSEQASSVSYTSPPAYARPFHPEVQPDAAPPSRAYRYAQNGNDRTVHTITFKLWNPHSSTSRELFVQETRADGNTHRATTLNTSFTSCWAIKIKPTILQTIGALFTMSRCAIHLLKPSTPCLSTLQYLCLHLCPRLWLHLPPATTQWACGPNYSARVLPSTSTLSRKRLLGRLPS